MIACILDESNGQKSQTTNCHDRGGTRDITHNLKVQLVADHMRKNQLLQQNACCMVGDKNEDMQYRCLDQNPNHTGDIIEDVRCNNKVTRITDVITSTQASDSKHIPKLVQAKINDNKFVLVQLLDDSAKSSLPSNLEGVADGTAVEICTTTTASLSPNEVTTTDDRDLQRNLQNRSSTPMSREFLALRKSVNESKILTEFVADVSIEKARKRKAFILSKDKDKDSPLPSDRPIESKNLSIYHDKEKIRRKSDYSPDIITCMPVMVYNDMEKAEVVRSQMTCQDVAISERETSMDISPKNNDKSRKLAYKLIPLKDGNSQRCPTKDLPLRRSTRSKSVSRKSPIEDPNVFSAKLKKWPSEEKVSKRSNVRRKSSTIFGKQLDFINSVTQDTKKNEDNTDTEEFQSIIGYEDEIESPLVDTSLEETIRGNIITEHEKVVSSAFVEIPNPPIVGNVYAAMDKYLERIWTPPPKRGWDSFCWKCRQCSGLIACNKCVRSFHPNCIKMTTATRLEKSWVCSECLNVENVLNGPKRNRRSGLSLHFLSQLLSFAVKRMQNVKGISQFLYSSKNILNFPKYFVNPVTLSSLQGKIERKEFRCAEEFVSETKWMHHNAAIAAGGISSSKDVITTKAILKICRQEANEIDTCAECYLNANTRNDWFVDVCSQPHLILWAKLKGFPYWPAKAMGMGQGSLVNVRFFGQHDRAFVPIKDCFLYSEQVPNAQTGKRSSRASFSECIQEVEVHIENIKAKVGAFKYAPYKTLYNPSMELEQLEMMMPGVHEYMKRRQVVDVPKPSLQYKIIKTADNHLSIIKKAAALDSGTDSDHSLNISGGMIGVTKTIKKKVENVDADHSKNTMTSKYEVISKITSDDSNSSKVSTVILKRKSEIFDNKNKGDDGNRPLPKSIRSEDNANMNNDYVVNEIEHRTENLDNDVGVCCQLQCPRPDPTNPTLPVLTSVIVNENKTIEGEDAELWKENNTQKQKTILIDLVPFVEIKQEVHSDDDVDKGENHNLTAHSGAIFNLDDNNENVSNSTGAHHILNNYKEPEAPLEKVKQEKPEEDFRLSNTFCTDTTNIRKQLEQDKSIENASEPVRIIGDTTIQRIPTKPIGSEQVNQPTFQPSEHVVANKCNAEATHGGNVRMLSNCQKRNVVREHNAYPETVVPTNGREEMQEFQLRQNQRARKSFPNREFSLENNINNKILNPSLAPAIATLNKEFCELEKPLSRTSMVSIPIDVATVRCNKQLLVPPLAAVSKTSSNAKDIAVCGMQMPLPSSTFASSNVSSSLINTSATVVMPIPPPLTELSVPVSTSLASTLAVTSSAHMNNVSSTVQSNNTNTTNTHFSRSFNDTLKSNVNEVICRELPKLAPRPNGPLQSDGSVIFPSQAGPVCRTLVENAHKLTDFFISVMEDTMCEMSVGEEPILQAKVTLLTMEMERTKQSYELEIAELKRSSELMICEMRKGLENEKVRIAAEVRRQCELERLHSVEETKKKQWCANCSREAQFYCCWNTSYCDYPCQQLHWSRHAANCAQPRVPCKEPSPAVVSINSSLANQIDNTIDRHHNSNNTLAIISANATNFVNKTVISNKKDKTSINGIMVSDSGDTAISSSNVKSPAYFRAVPSISNIKPPYLAQVPAQRINPSHSNAVSLNASLPYTLVQREGSWELLSAVTTAITTSNATYVTAPNPHYRVVSSTTLSTKSAPRNSIR